MIEKVSKITSKMELTPYRIYGSFSHNQNKGKNQNQDKKEENYDTFNKDDNKTNPFDLDEKRNDNKIQEYFNQRFSKINTDVKDVIFRISKNSKYTQLVDSAIIDSQALVARYLYNKTLPSEKDKTFKFIENDKYNSIEVYDLEDILLLRVDFVNSFIIKIKIFFEINYFEIYFKKQNFIDRLLGNTKTQIDKYQVKDKNSNIQEEIIYSSDGRIEKYLLYHDDKIQAEIYFDLSLVQFRPELKDKLIPLKYLLFDIKNDYLLEKLSYNYSIPNKYQQFNQTTGKIVKSFILQGLKSKVVKYSFFNSINGQMTACGSL